MMNIQKSDLELKVGKKSAKAYLAAPEKGGPGILVLHAWWGLKPFFTQVCDRLAGQGFTALAPDLFQGRTANTVEEAEAGLKLRDPDFMDAAAMAAQATLLSRTQSKHIGVLGFSLGAAAALTAAAGTPDQVSVAVLFYGTYPVEYGQIKAKILGHFSDQDDFEPLKDVRAMEAAMQAAGVDVSLHIYPGTSHWFMEDDRPQYDPAAASLAWERTFDFLKKHV